MKQTINLICIILGFIFLGIGVIGIVLPILPTTPFIIVSAGLFAKGSNKFHQWLLGTKIYQNYVSDVVTNKSLSKQKKIKILVTVSIIFLTSFILINQIHARICILLVALGHYYYFIFRLKTNDE